jgi:hypothetical protein
VDERAELALESAGGLSAMGRAQRDKGARGEREIVQILRDAGWKDARRSSDGRVQSARGDIVNGPAGVHIECKFVERLNVPAALRQVEEDANPLDLPVLVHRPSRQDWCATLPLDELLALLKLREAA